MTKIEDYINSGILEMYALGLTSPEENSEVLAMSNLHIEIKNEIDSIIYTLKCQSEERTQLKPSETLKPFLFSIIDYTERLKAGEEICEPPILNQDSKIIDYSEWLERSDIFLPDDFDEFHAKIIGYTKEAITTITWIKSSAPNEVHENEFERFLIIEGSCDITIEATTYHLRVGDYMEIPLYVNHNLVVTSEIPCKVILQRVAA
jgi:mannose-6-phosphate isomerase-like protein (cupin superfamily)